MDAIALDASSVAVKGVAVGINLVLVQVDSACVHSVGIKKITLQENGAKIRNVLSVGQ